MEKPALTRKWTVFPSLFLSVLASPYRISLSSLAGRSLSRYMCCCCSWPLFFSCVVVVVVGEGVRKDLSKSGSQIGWWLDGFIAKKWVYIGTEEEEGMCRLPKATNGGKSGFSDVL